MISEMSNNLNKDAINATIEVIKSHQDIEFYMGDFVQHDVNIEGNHCGTACCLAGYASIAQFGSLSAVKPSYTDKYGTDHYDYFTIGMEFFGLNNKDAGLLFIPSMNGHINNTNKEDAIKVLESLRDTGKIIWNDLPPYKQF